MNRSPEDLIALCSTEQRRVRMFCLQLSEAHPFWASLAHQIRFRMNPGMDAMACTDCHSNVWLNPLRTQCLNESQLGFVLLHELGHVVLITHERIRGRNLHLFNIASDYKINEMVSKIERPGHSRRRLYDIPQGHIAGLGEFNIYLDARYEGMTTEAVYEELASSQIDPPKSLSLELIVDENADPLTIDDVADHRGSIDIHLPHSLTAEELHRARQKISEAVRMWNARSRQGSIPGDVLRDLAAQARPKVPWRELMRRFASQTLGLGDYSFARPHRRYLPEGLIVPGPRAQQCALVVAALDTSGSIGEDALNAAASEIQAISNHVEELILLVCDARVQKVVYGSEIDAWVAAGKAPGGGGTDHRPVFEWIESQRLRPDLFVGLTDLKSHFPEQAPPYPVLWVTASNDASAPWGHTITINAQGENHGQ
jgi:predicted metal-dependent peptidase